MNYENCSQNTDSSDSSLEKEATETAGMVTQSNGHSKDFTHESVEAIIKSATDVIWINRRGSACCSMTETIACSLVIVRLPGIIELNPIDSRVFWYDNLF